MTAKFYLSKQRYHHFNKSPPNEFFSSNNTMCQFKTSGVREKHHKHSKFCLGALIPNHDFSQRHDWNVIFLILTYSLHSNCEYLSIFHLRHPQYCSLWPVVPFNWAFCTLKPVFNRSNGQNFKFSLNWKKYEHRKFSKKLKKSSLDYLLHREK